MNIGVTGANGHIGGNLVRRLLQEDHHIRVLKYRGQEALEGLDLEIFEGDLLDPESLRTFAEGMDTIIHLAGFISIGYNSFELLNEVNVKGTQNMVQAAKEASVKRFIHFSSIDAFDHKPLDKPLDENNPLALNSHHGYDKTKAVAHAWVLEQQSTDFDVIVMNPTSVIGPNDFKPSLQAQFISQICNGSLPGLVNGAYDWVDVRDICEATARAVYQGNGGENYILSGHYKSVPDFVALVGEVVGRKIKLPVFPFWLARMGVPFMYLVSKVTGEKPIFTKQSLEIIQSGNPDIRNDKARKELGYQPRPLATSLKDTIEWLKEHQLIKT